MDNDTKLINLALDAGEIMLKNGAETFRVQDTMQRILSVSGKEKIEALAMCTLLMVTLPREEKGPLSMARAVKNRDLNFEKICAVNDMSRAFVSGKISLDEAIERLKEIPHARLRLCSQRCLLCVYGRRLCAGFSGILRHCPSHGLYAGLSGTQEDSLLCRPSDGRSGYGSCRLHGACVPSCHPAG